MANYATLEEVRQRIDERPNIVTASDDEGTIGTGDGTTTKFYIPSGFIVDANGDESVTIADLTVYVDGSSVTISSVDAEDRSFTLAVAPGNGAAITADFSWSPIPDSEILAYIIYYTNRINRKTNTLFSASNSNTELYDGDGSNTRFYFEKLPVTSITSLTVDDDTSLVLDTDYWLYPSSSKADYIEFDVAPLTDHQNVSISYQYGEVNEDVDEWVILRSAADSMRYLMGKKGNVGFYVFPSGDGKFPSKSDSFSLWKTLTDDAKALEKDIPYLTLLDVA